MTNKSNKSNGSKTIKISDFDNLSTVFVEHQRRENVNPRNGLIRSKEPKATSPSDDYLGKVFHLFNELDDYTHLRLKQFPKSENFIIVKEIKLILLKIERLIVECSLKHHKKTTINNLEIEIELFRKYITRSFRRGYLKSEKNRDSWMLMTNNLGHKIKGMAKYINLK